MNKDFVMALNSNRTVAFSQEDKRQGHLARVDALPLEDKTATTGFHQGAYFTQGERKNSVQSIS
ncbi:MAG: hypothetical protein Q7T96_17535 [Methylobacter sp.]|nr:hypothetical protein [Methylobacter sp.]